MPGIPLHICVQYPRRVIGRRVESMIYFDPFGEAQCIMSPAYYESCQVLEEFRARRSFDREQ